MLGIAGWRALDDATTEATPTTASAAGDDDGGGAYLAVPDATLGVHVPRLLEVDALRGAWFLRTDHLHFLFREPLALPPTTAAANGGTAGSADLADEAEVSARLRRHADLPSLVVPVAAHDRSTWGDLRGGPLPPTAAQLRAWRRVLWRGAHPGDAPPPWRAAAAAAAAEPPAVARAAAAGTARAAGAGGRHGGG